MTQALAAIGAITLLIGVEVITTGAVQALRARRRRRVRQKQIPPANPHWPILQLLPMPADAVLVPNCIVQTYFKLADTGGVVRLTIAGHDRGEVRKIFQSIFPTWSPTPVADEMSDPAPGELKLFYKSPT